MMESTLLQAAQSMHGKLHGRDANFRGVSTDSRTISAGELFVALQGPNFDGRRFVEAAAGARAAGAVVARELPTALPLITVADTRKALGDLAGAWRRNMPATVVGVTGSNGKTTVKEMLAACLSVAAETLATEGNLNNDIGLPLMLLRLARKHRYAVLEMGANHAGEIGYLGSLAGSQVVVITNAAPAHLEGFGSLQGVAQAKGEILETESRPQVAVLNADDPYYDYWCSKVADLRVVSFALDAAATVSASDIQSGGQAIRFTLHLPDGNVPVEMPLAGRHNVLNACAAAAAAFALDIPTEHIQQGLASTRPVGGRLQPLDLPGGAILYDDSYNANPVSVMAAVEFLAAQTGHTILVLGDMAELGDEAAALHSQVGRAAAQAGVNSLFANGELARHAVEAFGDNGHWFAGFSELTDSLRKLAGPHSRILVKGSRAMRMERVIDALLDTRDTAEAG